MQDFFDITVNLARILGAIAFILGIIRYSRLTGTEKWYVFYLFVVFCIEYISYGLSWFTSDGNNRFYIQYISQESSSPLLQSLSKNWISVNIASLQPDCWACSFCWQTNSFLPICTKTTTQKELPILSSSVLLAIRCCRKLKKEMAKTVFQTLIKWSSSTLR